MSKTPKAKPKKSIAKTSTQRATKTRGRKLTSRAPGRKASAEQKLVELKRRLFEISDLWSAGAVLSWDQTTYMPTGGAVARGRQCAMLRRLAHERLADPALGRLIDELAPFSETLPYDADDASLIRFARRDFEKAIKIPPEYVARVNAHTAGMLSRP